MGNAAARGWIVVAALSGAIAVIVGAFAAHGLDLRTEAGLKARDWLQTGSHYEIFHALAMLGVCALAGAKLLNARLAVGRPMAASSPAASCFPARSTPCRSAARDGSALSRRSAASPSSWAGCFWRLQR